MRKLLLRMAKSFIKGLHSQLAQSRDYDPPSQLPVSLFSVCVVIMKTVFNKKNYISQSILIHKSCYCILIIINLVYSILESNPEGSNGVREIGT